MRAYFQMFAGYNAWANHRLHAACAMLGEGDYKADRGAFFGSIHGTLNHLIVTDRMWLARLRGEPLPPHALDAVIFDDLATLRAARVHEDAALSELVAGLTDERLAGVFRWTRKVDGTTVIQPLWAMLAHLFNHQTHHRGQVHDLLSQAGQDPPSLDLPVFQKASGLGFID
ncbi:MAG: damage-inducible protein DinB [Caulobacter sp.]|nr:damage-inducible protein DinB [Caulobacter sp.]